jgi:hypothetical protein
MTTMDARRTILERRARFVAAALAAAGLSCNESGAGPLMAAPLAVGSEAPSQEPQSPPRKRTRADAGKVVDESIEDDPAASDDLDQDGIPDRLDACPGARGAASPDPKKHGCPCLSIIGP